MGQVPQKSSDMGFSFPYLIVGSGRLALHLRHYFTLLEIPFVNWSRKHGSKTQLKHLVELSETVLLAISDDSISEFSDELDLIESQKLVHFSGSRTFDRIYGVHPFASFSDHLFSLDFYKSILFVCEEGSLFHELFPALENPTTFIEVKNKPRYHAQCVMLANGLGALLRGTQESMSGLADIQNKDLNQFIDSVSLNFSNVPVGFLTGPIVRNDKATILRNIESLETEEWKSLYEWLVNQVPKLNGDSNEAN